MARTGAAVAGRSFCSNGSAQYGSKLTGVPDHRGVLQSVAVVGYALIREDRIRVLGTPIDW